MGGVNVEGGGHGGKKSVDAEIPLIPFIDLLLCCVMFLLVTAVWNELARVKANQQTPGQAAVIDPPTNPRMKYILQIQTDGFVLASEGGDSVRIPKQGDRYDLVELKTKLQDRKQREPNRDDIIVAAEDGVVYENIVAAMDVASGEGFENMTLSDGAAL